MINPKKIYDELISNGIDFFTGVPDSLLKSFCSYITDNTNDENHIIAANEGNALAIATGYYLSSGKPALVYMQNSGLGNVINPLASLNDSEVYGIPALLLIGWRGEPGKKDASQHIKQGKVTLELLKTMGIKYYLLNEETKDCDVGYIIQNAIKDMNEQKKPVALVMSKGTFEKYSRKKSQDNNYELTREKSIDILLNNINEDYIVVSTTGKTSRELFELRDKYEQNHDQDFLVVGSMGHASSIGLGVAKNNKDKNIYVLDGDGAFIMHMGAISIIGQSNIDNFRHIVFNNGSHESVGGQPTVGHKIDMISIAKACGYELAFRIETEEDFKKVLEEISGYKGKVLLEIRIKNGSRDDLGRPTISLEEMKNSFMEKLN